MMSVLEELQKKRARIKAEDEQREVFLKYPNDLKLAFAKLYVTLARHRHPEWKVQRAA